MNRPTTYRTVSTLSATVLALCIASLSACSSKDSTTTSADTSAGAASAAAADASPAGSPTTAVTDAQAASGSADVPVYPGAASTPATKHPNFDLCGHHMKIASYDSADAEKTVFDWYKAHVPGGAAVEGDSDPQMASGEILTSDGTNIVVVMQMHFDNDKLQGAAKTLGADKTSIGIETFDPPLGQDYVNLALAAKSNDPSAVNAAKAKLAAMCPNG